MLLHRPLLLAHAFWWIYTTARSSMLLRQFGLLCLCLDPAMILTLLALGLSATQPLTDQVRIVRLLLGSWYSPMSTRRRDQNSKRIQDKGPWLRFNTSEANVIYNKKIAAVLLNHFSFYSRVEKILGLQPASSKNTFDGTLDFSSAFLLPSVPRGWIVRAKIVHPSMIR
jgi:hypothetical protein